MKINKLLFILLFVNFSFLCFSEVSYYKLYLNGIESLEELSVIRHEELLKDINLIIKSKNKNLVKELESLLAIIKSKNEYYLKIREQYKKSILALDEKAFNISYLKLHQREDMRELMQNKFDEKTNYELYVEKFNQHIVTYYSNYDSEEKITSFVKNKTIFFNTLDELNHFYHEKQIEFLKIKRKFRKRFLF